MRIMAIDYGEARTGVAISDPTRAFVGETAVFTEPGMKKTAARIIELAESRGVGTIVVGYPKNMNGTVGPRAELSEKLRNLLAGRSGLAVELWDERLSTAHAHRILGELGRSGKKRKPIVDAVAASLILETYMSAHSGD